MQKKRGGRGKKKDDRFFLVTLVRKFIALFSLRAAPINFSLGSLLEMWRAKIQKWCSNSLSICFSYFLNVTVTLHKGRVIVALHPIKKRYHPILYSFFFPSLSFSQLFSSSLLSPLKKNLSATTSFLSQSIAQPSIPSSSSSPSKKNPSPQTHFLAISQNPTGTHFTKPNRYPFLGGVSTLAWGGALELGRVYVGIIYVIFCVEMVELGLCGFDRVVGVGVGVMVMLVCGVTVWIWVYVGLIWLSELELWW